MYKEETFTSVFWKPTEESASQCLEDDRSNYPTSYGWAEISSYIEERVGQNGEKEYRAVRKYKKRLSYSG